MKKLLKGFTALVLSLVCFLTGFPCNSNASDLYAKPLVVQAAELNSTFTVKFVIVDSTSGYDGNSFTVKMDDIQGAATKEYEIKKAASWGNTSGNIPSVSVSAPTTYNLSISGLNDGYKLRDFMSGKDIDSSFAATNNGEITFYWEIVEGSADASTTSETVVDAANATTNVVAENTDAESVYAEFLNTVSFIKDDSSWSSMLEGYSYPSLLSTFGNMYANCVNAEGKSEEDMLAEYEAMSNYDKFLWVSTYLFMADSIKNGHPDNVSSYDKIIANSACPIQNMQIGNRTKADEVIAAYEKLIQWQADYIAANGSPFNFINNRSYLEEMEVSNVDAPTEDEVKEQEQKEIEKAREEIEKTEDEKDKGVWSDTLDILSSNLVTILILVVLLGGLGYVLYLKKKNNFTDEIHEK